MYWLEVITEAKLIASNITEPLLKEANELVSIFVATAKRVKTNNQKS